jgi:hypothetical protein
MQVPQAQLLALKVIARLWAGELRGTSLEEHSDILLNRMRSDFATGKLEQCSNSKSLSAILSRNQTKWGG